MDDIKSDPILTPRERQIVELAGLRFGDKEIAQHLNLSPRTIQNHLHRAYEKLGVSDRLQASKRLSEYYSEQPNPLPSAQETPPQGEVSAASCAALEQDGAKSGLKTVLAVFHNGRQPRKLGGSLLWLIFGWALVWLIVAAVGASLTNAVLESVHRLQ